MEVYNVGPDELCDFDGNECFEWVVYFYENYGYEGSGEAVGLNKDGYFYFMNLGHCSCYGPTEDGWTKADKITLKEFLREKDHVFDFDCMEVIKSKIMSLL